MLLVQITTTTGFSTRPHSFSAAAAGKAAGLSKATTGAGLCIRDTDIENDLCFSWNFGRYPAGTQQGNLRFLANSFSSMSIQVDLSTVLESS